MTYTHHTKLDLVEGGNIFKQGDHPTLKFIAYDSLGNEVDLTGKQIEGALFSRNKGIIYEAPASFTDGRIVFTINELLDNGKFQLEFTVTDSADPDYRAKFPSDEYAAQLTIKPSKDNMDFVGVSMTTVVQLKTELQGLQTEFAGQVLPRVDIVEDKQTQLEADYQAAAGALTEDSEVILARKGEPTLRAFNDKITTQLDEKAEQKDLKGRGINVMYPPIPMVGLKGDGTDDTDRLASLLIAVPEKSKLIFPPNFDFSFANMNTTKAFVIEATGAKFSQISTATGPFILMSGNETKWKGGELDVNLASNGLVVKGKDSEVVGVKINGGNYAFDFYEDILMENCVSVGASYAGCRLFLSTGAKKKKLTIKDFTALDFKFKGLVYNGTTGAEEIVIENLRTITTSQEAASDCLLFDAGNGHESSYFVDRLIVKGAYMFGGESNSSKIYNVSRLELHSIYSKNDQSNFASSTAFNLNAKEVFLNDIETHNRIVTTSDIFVNGWDFRGTQGSKAHVLELSGAGEKCVIENFDMSKSTSGVTDAIIRVGRNSGVNHKIITDNFVGRGGVKPFAIYTVPPNDVGFIENRGRFETGGTLTGNTLTGVSNRDAKVIRQPRTFMATALPTTGAYVRGDIIYNFSPAAGGKLGWVCTSGGTFGSGTDPAFKAFGSIDA